MKTIMIAILIVLAINSTTLIAETNTTDETLKNEFIEWLNNNNIEGINYGEIDSIIDIYDSEYVKNVMQTFVMPDPSGHIWWEDFMTEFFPVVN